MSFIEVVDVILSFLLCFSCHAALARVWCEFSNCMHTRSCAAHELESDFVRPRHCILATFHSDVSGES